jgi:YHYH protein
MVFGGKMLKIKTVLFTALPIFAAVHCSNTLSSTPYCNTYMDSGVSSTFSSNFTCTQVSVSGSSHVFKSSNLPNHKSYYYGSSSDLYEPLPTGNTSAGTNKISSQNLKYTIPTTGTLKTDPLTGTQAGYASVGITANGLAIFNNAAAPPDNLSKEAGTFDNYAGHPQNSGVYHHHAAVTKLSATMADATLIGVALDGFLIYAEYCNSGSGSDFKPTAHLTAATGSTATDTGAGNGDSATTLDRLHGHTTTTKHLPTATYHYHYAQDPTATIKTILAGYFRGVPGTVSN